MGNAACGLECCTFITASSQLEIRGHASVCKQLQRLDVTFLASKSAADRALVTVLSCYAVYLSCLKDHVLTAGGCYEGYFSSEASSAAASASG